MRAERRCGQLLAETERGRAGRPPENQSHDTTDFRGAPTLVDLNISRDQSSRRQKAAFAGRDTFRCRGSRAIANRRPMAFSLRTSRHRAPFPSADFGIGQEVPNAEKQPRFAARGSDFCRTRTPPGGFPEFGDTFGQGIGPRRLRFRHRRLTTKRKDRQGRPRHGQRRASIKRTWCVWFARFDAGEPRASVIALSFTVGAYRDATHRAGFGPSCDPGVTPFIFGVGRPLASS